MEIQEYSFRYGRFWSKREGIKRREGEEKESAKREREEGKWKNYIEARKNEVIRENARKQLKVFARIQQVKKLASKRLSSHVSSKKNMIGLLFNF